MEPRILDLGEDGVYTIHNWEQRQPNCYNRDKISAQKSRAVSTRWDRERAKNETRERRKTRAKSGSTDDDTSSIHGDKQLNYPNPTQLYNTLSLLSPERSRARAIFERLLHEQVPQAELKSPERWDKLFGRLLDQVEAVIQFALSDSFWRSRVLSPKSFGANYAKLLVQMIEQQQAYISVTVPQQNGMTAEEWDKLKQKRNVESNDAS